MQKKHHIVLYSLLAVCAILAVAYAVEAESETRRTAATLEEAYQGAAERPDADGAGARQH